MQQSLPNNTHHHPDTACRGGMHPGAGCELVPPHQPAASHSPTVTVKVEGPAVLPAASAAEQDTVEVPRGKMVPEAGVQVTVGEAVTSSEAWTEKSTLTPELEAASAVMDAGTVSCGLVVSTAQQAVAGKAQRAG